jgi:hypothetical protein
MVSRYGEESLHWLEDYGRAVNHLVARLVYLSSPNGFQRRNSSQAFNLIPKIGYLGFESPKVDLFRLD